MIDEDLDQWANIRRVAATDNEDLFLTLMLAFPEFRNLLYYRLRRLGSEADLVAKVAQRLWRPVATLDFSCEDIGSGLVISHGHGTILSAKRIGKNCWIHHEVTIGWDYGGGQPTIGDGVFIGAGAKVLGDLTVGDGARIGANAVVIGDVPPRSTAVGVPARIKRRHLD